MKDNLKYRVAVDSSGRFYHAFVSDILPKYNGSIYFDSELDAYKSALRLSDPIQRKGRVAGHNLYKISVISVYPNCI